MGKRDLKVKSKVGEKHMTNDGYEVEITEYINALNCSVVFKDGTVLKNKQYYHIKKGSIKNPLHPIISGVGYMGFGVYKSAIKKKRTKAYSVWQNLLHRCYDENNKSKDVTYKNCSVYLDWHNFQNFAKWFEENYIEGFELDKDILVRGNKIYSPETCCFVPAEINSLFAGTNKTRDNNILGVIHDKRHNVYYARLSKNNNQTYLGSRNTVNKAFELYKTAKEEYIKELAEKYKKLIIPECYDAMCNYEVNITD